MGHFHIGVSRGGGDIEIHLVRRNGQSDIRGVPHLKVLSDWSLVNFDYFAGLQNQTIDTRGGGLLN